MWLSSQSINSWVSSSKKWWWDDVFVSKYDINGLINCNSSSVLENSVNKLLVKTIDLLGRESNKSGFFIKIFDNGSIEKGYIINQ